MKAPVATTKAGGVGESVIRPDGAAKATGAFEYLGDMAVEGMLWMAVRRSTLARARIVSVDKAPALSMTGVRVVLTVDDVPGGRYQGQIHQDQPVLAEGEVRHWGEPIAVAVADDLETARAGAEAAAVELEPLPPLLDVDEALERGEVFRTVNVRSGDDRARGEVVVVGEYRVGSQDQAPLGAEAGLAAPDGEGGVDIWGPTQWVHVDRAQLARCLGLEEEKVRVRVGGVGGAFGAREDLTVQTHLAMAALRTGRPVKTVLNRAESFAAHVKRHPAVMRYRHEAGRDGTLARVEATLLLDGGAYHSTSEAVVANAAFFAVGPYRCRSTRVEAHALRTNRPPSGAMRGFGANQAAFAAEAQMDRLAARLGLDPMELRRRNALGPGDVMPTTGQRVVGPLPTVEVIDAVLAAPLPEEDDSNDPRRLPGGVGLTTSRSHVRRGVGYALGFKNIAFSEGFDDYAEAEVELGAEGAVVRTAAVEVGQGMVTILQQIARTALGVEDVRVEFVDTGRIGSAGSTSASRQTQMAGGAVLEACQRLSERRRAEEGLPMTERVRFRHPPTEAPDEYGQGDLHAGFCVAAQRAIVDVDPELGLVRVVRIDAAQDVGRALNPVQVVGQIEGGVAQGMGHTVMEELTYGDDGALLNPSFTDYLIPTSLDMPAVEATVVEVPGGWGPYGAKGFAETPTVAATPAVAAAIRDATGRSVTRAPTHPTDLVP